jgi:hypothetical protein
MTISELIQRLEKLREEVGCDGEMIGSHTFPSYVHFWIENPEIDLDLEFTGLELNYLPGCMCPSGITFNLKGSQD